MPSGTSAPQNPLKSPQSGIDTILHSGLSLDILRASPSIAWRRGGRHYLLQAYLYAGDRHHTVVEGLAQPLGRSRRTATVHPGRAHRCARETPRPASARGPRRSAPHRRWCDGGATRPGRDHRRAGTGEASDTADARGLNGLSQGHGWQAGGESPRQHRRARPRGLSKRR
jgi:hypothetical protein